MKMPKNQFKEWLNTRRKPVPLGTWMMTGSATVAEAMGFVGFDFLVMDMEHVPVDTNEAIDIMRALAGTPTTEVLARLPWNELVIIKRALDAGATSLMFPFIQNKEEAQFAVNATRYPVGDNGGTRGVAAVHRASRFGQYDDYMGQANDNICVVLQLETPTAIENMAEIASVDGVDALFIGPGDLAANMGHIGDIAHPDVQAALKAGLEKCHELGKACGIVGGNPELVCKYIEWGFDFVAIASDMSMMIARAKEQISAVRGKNEKISGGAVY